MSEPHIPAASRDAIRDGARRSAEVLATLIDGFTVDTVLDVGCGEGYLVEALRRRDIAALGLDGDPLPGVDEVVDFDGPLPDVGRYDLVTCLEVAEHVRAAEPFVEWLCAAAPLVLFSAAVPGQGGDGHVNERPTGYWVELFAVQGYRGSGALRWRLWEDERVEWWYRQNLLVFWDPDVVDPGLAEDGCPTVIHPGMWQHHHGSEGWR